MLDWIFARYLLPGASRRHETLVADRKKQLLEGIASNSIVVELGPGTGPNFRYFPPGIEWIGVEPNRHLHIHLDNRRVVHDIREIQSQSADAVVCTLVLCSVDDIAAVLQESLRILKPGGRFYFLEHVAAPRGTRLYRLQRILRPFWKIPARGCDTCRDTLHAIRAAFPQVEAEPFSLPLGPVSPHIAGVATKSVV